jgi:hypothetical protein
MGEQKRTRVICSREDTCGEQCCHRKPHTHNMQPSPCAWPCVVWPKAKCVEVRQEVKP